MLFIFCTKLWHLTLSPVQYAQHSLHRMQGLGPDCALHARVYNPFLLHILGDTDCHNVPHFMPIQSSCRLLQYSASRPKQTEGFLHLWRALSVYIFALWGKAIPGMSFPSSPVQLCWCVCLLSCCDAMGYNILRSFSVCSLLPKRDWNLIKYKGVGWKLE